MLIYSADHTSTKKNAKVVWLGTQPLVEAFAKTKKGKVQNHLLLIFHDKKSSFEIALIEQRAQWLMDVLDKASMDSAQTITFQNLQESFEGDFEDFWSCRPMQVLRENGLVLV